MYQTGNFEYQVYEDCKVLDKTNYVCFSQLFGLKEKAPYSISVKYFLKNTPFDKEQVLQFNDLFNTWGLPAMYDESDKSFTVNKTEYNYLCLLAPLVARRYMEEVPNILKQFLKLEKKYPQISKFALFQLAHLDFGTNAYNYNHTFMKPYSCYTHLPKICTVTKFRDNVKNVPSKDRVGLDRITLNSQPITASDSMEGSACYKANHTDIAATKFKNYKDDYEKLFDDLNNN